jgi:hypothetical protein
MEAHASRRLQIPGGDDAVSIKMTARSDQGRPRDGQQIEKGLSQILEGSPLLEVAAALGDYLGVGCDFLSFAMLQSYAAGRMGMPINLAIHSESPGSDSMIADRISNLLPKRVHRLDTVKQFRSLADAGFADVDVVVLRNLHGALFRYACEVTCRDVAAEDRIPSLWLITDSKIDKPVLGPTIRILASQTSRMLRGFGHHFSEAMGELQRESRDYLARLLKALAPPPVFRCNFQAAIRADLRPEEMVVVNRLLRVVAALRVASLYDGKSCATVREFDIPLEDYGLTRSFLMGLAITPTHSNLSPYAVDTAEILYEAIVLNPNYQLTVPDHSRLGQKLFTRRDAEQIAGLSYNTVKSHMSELENEGILESTRVESQREKGRQIFFRFNGHPPFGVAAHYERLPSQDRIAADDSGLQETNAILTSTGTVT